ncbi:hypothetical protein BC830DRAFT_394261 [Chytriomyces sp. MP71]|nr:hypothetical protein BC830DRAFT_394261 [Chytriomyces sp. MP71]
MWRTISEKDKLVYQERAADSRKAHEEAMQAYFASRTLQDRVLEEKQVLLKRQLRPNAKRARLPRDPRVPRRPVTAYSLFVADKGKGIASETGESPIKIVSQQWKALSEEERKPYTEKANLLRQEYYEAINSLDEESGLSQRNIKNRLSHFLRKTAAHEKEKIVVDLAAIPSRRRQAHKEEREQHALATERNLEREQAKKTRAEQKLEREQDTQRAPILAAGDGRTENAAPVEGNSGVGSNREQATPDSKAPSTPPSAYLLFIKDSRVLKGKHVPGQDNPLVVKSRMWKALSEEEKKPYQEKSEQFKKEYQEAMKEYKAKRAVDAQADAQVDMDDEPPLSSSITNEQTGAFRLYSDSNRAYVQASTEAQAQPPSKRSEFVQQQLEEMWRTASDEERQVNFFISVVM